MAFMTPSGRPDRRSKRIGDVRHKRIASYRSPFFATLAYQFACHSKRALEAMDQHMVEAWAMSATDQYDKQGLYPAMSVIKNLDQFIDSAHDHACGAVFEEEASILLPFLQGLAGRKLKLAEAEQAYTDTETIFIPAITALFENKKENFLHYKVSVAYLWAQ